MPKRWLSFCVLSYRTLRVFWVCIDLPTWQQLFAYHLFRPEQVTPQDQLFSLQGSRFSSASSKLISIWAPIYFPMGLHFQWKDRLPQQMFEQFLRARYWLSIRAYLYAVGSFGTESKPSPIMKKNIIHFKIKYTKFIYISLFQLMTNTFRKFKWRYIK